MTTKELEQLVEEFCNSVLDSSKGAPPYITLTPKEEDFVKSFKKNFSQSSLTVAEHEIVRGKVNSICQIYFKKSINEGTVPYYTLPEENTAKQLSDLFESYCKIQKTTFPVYLKNLLIYISEKAMELDNINQFITKQRERDISSKVKGSEAKLSQLSDEIKAADTELKKVQKSLEKSEKTMIERTITILGIFSAIVLTFNAGVSFSSIVMENLISSSIYRATLITSLLGLILGNVILGLFAYLEHIRKKSNETENANTEKNYSWIVLVVTDSILIVIMVATAIGWRLGWIENRDKEVYAESPPITTQADPNMSVDLNGSLYFESTTSNKQDDQKENVDPTNQPTSANNN